MSVRMRHLLGVLALCIGTGAVVSCGEQNPYETPQTALNYALDSLYAHNYGAYIRSVAPGHGAEVLTDEMMRKLLTQHVEGIEQRKGRVLGVDVVDTCSISDSLYSVFYRLNFSTGESEVSSQTMICVGGEWKIRARN